MSPNRFQSTLSIQSMLRSLAALKGRKGSKAIERLAEICRARFMMVCTRAMSVLANFQGSVSARYLLPQRAKSIASLRASRKWKCSMWSLSTAFTFLNSSMAARSTSVSSPAWGTMPSQNLCVSTRARFTKLPRIATNSLLLRAWKSFHVKSLSLVSGALAVST